MELKKQIRTIKVRTFQDLPEPTLIVKGWVYEVLESSGIKYCPSFLTGKPYQPSGEYVSDGLNWNLKR